MNRAKLIAFCRSLPEATEDIKWGKDLVFSIGAKMFAVFNTDGAETVSFKTTPEIFASLTKKPGIEPAPYAARFHWVFVAHAKAMPQDMACELIEQSYQLVAGKLPANVRKKLGLDKK